MRHTMEDTRHARVTERDLGILRWMTRHGLVTADQVAHQFFTSPWAAYRRLRALGMLGLIRRDATHYRHPAVIRVTTAGARLAAVGVGPAPLVLDRVSHSLALVDLTERLLADHPDATLTTEREYKAHLLRALRAGVRPTKGRIPDGILRLSSPDGTLRVALELDLTAKGTRQVEQVITAYASLYIVAPIDEGFNRVWWYAAPGAVPRMQAIVDRENANFLIEVREWRP